MPAPYRRASSRGTGWLFLAERPRAPRIVCSDTNLAREYELEIDTQFVPLNIYTRVVDYPDVEVQVRDRNGAREARLVGGCRVDTERPSRL